MWSWLGPTADCPPSSPRPLGNFRGPTSMLLFSILEAEVAYKSRASAAGQPIHLCTFPSDPDVASAPLALSPPLSLSLSSWDLTGLQSRGEPSS